MTDCAATKLELKKKRSTAKGKFHRIYNRLIAITEKQDVKETFTDLKRAFEDLEYNHERYVLVLDDEDEDEKKTVQDVNDDMEVLYEEYCKARNKLTKVFQAEEEERKVERVFEPQQKRDTIKVKRLEAPSFTGNIRAYPSFRRDYYTHMVTAYGNDAFALKSCLKDDALRLIQGVDSNFEEMIKRLDAKYGRPEKITDSILNDIKRLKRINEGETTKFITMVEIVERCWLDLKQMGIEREMNTATMMSHIEKLLPPVQRREWALQVQKDDANVTGGVQFKTFMDYLLQEKQAMEYMQQDFRHSESSKKDVCSADVTEHSSHEESGIINALQRQMKENQIALSKVVEGLAQVSQAISSVDHNRIGDSRTKKRCWHHGIDNHSIYDCSAFKALDLTDKIESVRKNGACFNCLKVGHLSRNCGERKPCETRDTEGKSCGRYHHPILHSTNVNKFSFHNSAQDSDSVLLMISKVVCRGMEISTLWDPGANVSLITHEAAKRLGLSGEQIHLNITKVGNTTDRIQTRKYKMPLTDNEGKCWNIEVYGMNEVTKDAENINLEEITKVFKNIAKEDIKRPAGRVELLIGTDCCKILPKVVDEAGNLQLLKNQFGYRVRGSNSNSDSINHVLIHLLSGVEVETYTSIMKESKILAEDVRNFLYIEGLGIQVHPKCGKCGCGKCVLGSSPYTIQEEREMHLIDSGLNYNEEEERFTIIYPWIRSAVHLPNNYNAALGRLQSTRKRLVKHGKEYLGKYNEQIIDMVERKAARIVTREERKNYCGPVHYVPHHEILKPDSLSTPLRIVFDSSSSYMGHVLNNYWAKGPCIINDLLGVLLRFRQKVVALVADISKMYNSVKMSILDQHTHRFLWGEIETGVEPDHYILLNVPFGDRPSGTIAILALQKTAKLSKIQYPKEAHMIENDSYVDDILISVDDVAEAREVAGRIDKILKRGGFVVKHWVISGKYPQSMHEEQAEGGDEKLEFLESEEEKILGMKWNPKADLFLFKVKLNFSSVNRGIYVEKDLRQQDIQFSVPENLTKRMVLSQISKIFDPLGLISPFTLEAKLLMREIFTDSNVKCWDVRLSEEKRMLWVQFFTKLFQMESLTFPRSVKEINGFENPVLVVFSDASQLAYGACAYVRWQVNDKEFRSCLIAAKNRISPTRTLSIPRLELCGAVIGSRLRKKIEEEIKISFLKVFHIVDSSIVQHQIQKESYGFATFVAVRIGEIQSCTDPTEWWWIPSNENPADMMTRITPIKYMDRDSIWQRGPEFMQKPIQEWPISKECTLDTKDLPDKVQVTMSVEKVQNSSDLYPNLGDIDLQNYHSVHKLHKVTSLIVLISRMRTFKDIPSFLSASIITEIELLWIKYVQLEISKNWQQQFRSLGPIITKDGIIVVGKRLATWLKGNWNRKMLFLLPPKHKYTNLVLLTAHEEHHESVETTLEKIRRNYWIPRARKTLKGIRGRCVSCRIKDKKPVGQEMGNLPNERISPSPPFYNAAVDLFGPFTIRGTVNKRSRGKAYGVLFNCLASRAVYIDIAVGYDTDSFLMVLRRFVTIRGYPKTLLSDAGTQLVAASKELKEISEKWDWNRIKSFGHTQGMDWNFTKSADAPWENGCSESLIKLAKRNILSSVGTNVLNFSELQTVMFEISNLLNERPIGTKTNDPNEGSCCCPNDLLLGRASISVPPGKWDVDANTKKRWEIVQMITNTYWKKWMRDYFHTLILRKKWHTEKRNLEINDVVLIPDANTIRGNWKLGQIVEAVPGSDGRVRDVSVKYKIQDSALDYKGVIDKVIRRSAHRLVLILPIEEQSIDMKIQ